MGKQLRVLHIIDSFDVGGAERISITFANSLAEIGMKSYICATRRSGKLENTINSKVEKIILNKRSTFDLKAIKALIIFIKNNKINIIHAHSSSFLIAVIIKFFIKVKIVWHDHNGNRYKQKGISNSVLKYCSVFFDYVLVVNKELKDWSTKNLNVQDSHISYIQNFPELILQNSNITLPGTKDKRVVCLANLRWQKDHMTLLKAFKEVLKKYSDYHLILIGEDKKDEYSDKIYKYIKDTKLSQNIHVLGSRTDSADILINASIGIISSKSEGLPVSLLEYGLAKLAVISTDVGDCSRVLEHGKYGKVVPKENSQELANAIIELISNEAEKKRLSEMFEEHINKNYSKESVVTKLVNIYKEVLNG